MKHPFLIAKSSEIAKQFGFQSSVLLNKASFSVVKLKYLNSETSPSHGTGFRLVKSPKKFWVYARW